MEFSPRVLNLLQERYLWPNEEPEEMFDRVAFSVAMNSKEYKHFKRIFNDLAFIPSTPILTNAGSNIPSLFACYFLSIPDNIDGIMEMASISAKIYKHSGGLGIDLSNIRPRGSLVRTTRTIASGPVSFLHIFDSVAEVVKQGSRRAAVLGSLNIYHQDAEEFILAKNLQNNGGNEGYLKNFNLSVIIPNKFFEELNSGSAREQELFDLLANSIWTSGEPGIILIDRHNAAWPLSYKRPIQGVNACGELSMTHGESCCLGAINLLKVVKNFTIDYNYLEELVRLGVHFLDNVISISTYPTSLIESTTKELRKIGLGTMGLHSMLLALGLQYNDQEAYNITDQVYKFINDTAIDESERMAKKLGPFPAYDDCNMAFPPRRNITLTSGQPSGSTSMIASGTGLLSSGIEPFFSNQYIKDTIGGEQVELPDNILCAVDLTYEEHICMLEVCQRHIGSSVSKTINMPNSATVEDVKSAIKRMYEGGIVKNITLYRDGSRDKQVLNNLKRSGCRGGVCSL